MEDMSSPFVSLIEEGQRVTSAMSYDHTAIRKTGPVFQIEDIPGYLQVIHDRNLANRLPRSAWRVPRSFLSELFPLPVLRGRDNQFEIWLDWCDSFLRTCVRSVLPSRVRRLILLRRIGSTGAASPTEQEEKL